MFWLQREEHARRGKLRACLDRLLQNRQVTHLLAGQQFIALADRHNRRGSLQLARSLWKLLLRHIVGCQTQKGQQMFLFQAHLAQNGLAGREVGPRLIMLTLIEIDRSINQVANGLLIADGTTHRRLNLHIGDEHLSSSRISHIEIGHGQVAQGTVR